jgi:transposase
MVKTIDLLCAENKALKAELAVYRNKKDSSNSHKPPSTDIARPKRNQSLREKTGKKPGGQPGHEGKTLSMVDEPDTIVVHAPCICGKCCKDISAAPLHFLESRQVADIPPPPQIVWTEHQVYGRKCECGHVTEGVFPAGINAPVQYGSNTIAMIAYLHARQYIPFERMAEFFEAILGLPISPGSIANIILRFADKATVAYEGIKKSIEQAAYVGTDETGVKVNGQKNWFWTWQNEEGTYIVHSSNRGYATIEANFPDGFPDTVLVHDRWAAQLKSIAADHQICLAHLLRDLNFIAELHESQWARDFKTIIKEAIALNNNRRTDHDLFIAARDALESRVSQLLTQPLPQAHHKAITLQKQLCKINSYILAFLRYADVPAHNNASEQAIRNVKVKQKISGQFKSEKGAQAFAKIRSVIDTVIKSGKEVFQELNAIANLTPLYQ